MKFPQSAVPNKSTISRLIDKFRDTGSVQGRKRPGRPSLLTAEVLDDVSQRLTHSPRKYLRKLSSQVGLSPATVFRATKKLKFHADRIGVVHELKEPDHDVYGRWFRSFVDENGIEVSDRVYFSDKTWFHLDGYVNMGM